MFRDKDALHFLKNRDYDLIRETFTKMTTKINLLLFFDKTFLINMIGVGGLVPVLCKVLPRLDQLKRVTGARIMGVVHVLDDNSHLFLLLPALRRLQMGIEIITMRTVHDCLAGWLFKARTDRLMKREACRQILMYADQIRQRKLYRALLGFKYMREVSQKLDHALYQVNEYLSNGGDIMELGAIEAVWQYKNPETFDWEPFDPQTSHNIEYEHNLGTQKVNINPDTDFLKFHGHTVPHLVQIHKRSMMAMHSGQPFTVRRMMPEIKFTQMAVGVDGPGDVAGDQNKG